MFYPLPPSVPCAVSPRPHDPSELGRARERLAALALDREQSDRRKAALEREIESVKGRSLQVEQVCPLLLLAV